MGPARALHVRLGQMTRGQRKRLNSTASVPSPFMHCRSVQGYFGRLEANRGDRRPFCRGLTELTLRVDVVSGAGQKQHRRYWCGNDCAIDINFRARGVV